MGDQAALRLGQVKQDLTIQSGITCSPHIVYMDKHWQKSVCKLQLHQRNAPFMVGYTCAWNNSQCPGMVFTDGVHCCVVSAQLGWLAVTT